MNITYQLFEIDDRGALVIAKHYNGEPLKEYISEDEAIKELESSAKLREYIILKKISIEYNLADDLADGY